jgi:ABC-type multidrug transport system permease subunit
MAMVLTALAFVTDKRDGSLDRVFASGVLPSELLFGHVITQFAVLLIQLALLLFCALYLLNVVLVDPARPALQPALHNLGWVVALTVMCGMAGMNYGLVVSSVCAREEEAIRLTLGSFFPVLLLSGVIWPVEAIPAGLRYVAWALPTTWGASAMRSLLNRGWGFFDGHIWESFAIVAGT